MTSTTPSQHLITIPGLYKTLEKLIPILSDAAELTTQAGSSYLSQC